MGQIYCGTRTVATHGTQTENYDMARLVASASKHSGDWLHAIPISSCGHRLNDEAIRIEVGLHLGLDIYEPNTCVCGAMVDVRGSHALSCKRSSGRFIRQQRNERHYTLFSYASQHSCYQEPAGLMRTDRKRSDGLTLIPWREGRCLKWDAKVADIVAASYLPSTAMAAGSAAESAAARKETKYAELWRRDELMPAAFETHGSSCMKTADFVSELWWRISAATAEKVETWFFFQRLFIALHRLNAVCVSDISSVTLVLLLID